MAVIDARRAKVETLNVRRNLNIDFMESIPAQTETIEEAIVRGAFSCYTESALSKSDRDLLRKQNYVTAESIRKGKRTNLICWL